jgi:site-specific DNA-methyltransferase (adenine-specific)
MGDEKRSFLDIFYRDGELLESKLRGIMLQWTESRGHEYSDDGGDIKYRNDITLLTAAFADFEGWLGRKTDYYDDDVQEERSREQIRSVFEEFYESNDDFREYIDEHAVKVDTGGSEVEESDDSDESEQEGGGGFRYGELHEVGLVSEENEINRSKLMGSMLTFAKKVEAIEAPDETPNKRGFVQAWNRFMMDRFTSDWIHFTKEKLDPDQMKALVDDLYAISDEIEALTEEKWEYSPDEREGNSGSDVPSGVTGWSDYENHNESKEGNSTNGSGSVSDASPDDSESENGACDSSGSGDSSYVLPSDGVVNEIIHGDSVHVISEIAESEGKIVDAVITDVPYGQDFDPRSADEDGIHGDANVRKAMDINEAVFKKMRMVVKKGSPVMTFAGDSCLFEMKDVIEKWYNFKQIAVWDKSHIGMSSLEDNAIRWRPKHEYIILGCNGDPRRENANRHDGTIMEFTRPHGDDRFHPTEKPEELMRYLVGSFTEEGDVILDPFAGSGVTLDAARQLNRKYIGIEINEEFYEKINERLSQMTLV